MICLGLSSESKNERIHRYCKEKSISKVYLITPLRFRTDFTVPDGVALDVVEWNDAIEYKFYYRLLKEIDRESLVVVNECLRRQDRGNLTYNCIRLYLQQTPHALIFQYLPFIDTWDDFAILFDFETRSQWRRDSISRELLREAQIEDESPRLTIESKLVSVSEKTHIQYSRERERLFSEIRSGTEKDPHNIPRALALVSGRDKASAVNPWDKYVARNRRLKLPNLETYKDAVGIGQRVVLEFPHNFVDFADFLSVSRQKHITAIVSDTKADSWYWQRYVAWTERLRDAQAMLLS